MSLDAGPLAASAHAMSTGDNSRPRHLENRASGRTAECAWVSTPSISAEIPAVSRFQSTMCGVAAGRPSFFTSRDWPQIGCIAFSDAGSETDPAKLSGECITEARWGCVLYRSEIQRAPSTIDGAILMLRSIHCKMAEIDPSFLCCGCRPPR